MLNSGKIKIVRRNRSSLSMIGNSLKKIRKCLVVMGLSMVFSDAHSQGLNSPEPNTFPLKQFQSNHSNKSPLSATAFWKKIMTLLSDRDGFVSKEMFESIFDIKLKHYKDLENNVKSYGLNRGDDWYVGVNLLLSHNEKESYINLGWSEQTFGDPDHGECLSTHEAESEIIQNGWKPSFNSRIAPMSDSFTKNNRRLIIYLGSYDCFYSIKFGNSN